jgi:hypothetical protein
MDELLIRSLAPVLQDVRRTNLDMTFELVEYEWDSPVSWIATGMLRMAWSKGQNGTGVQESEKDPHSVCVAHLADVLQDVVIEETLVPWPPCPWHLDGGHPLLAVSTGDVAMWTCPSDELAVAAVGQLKP